MRSQVGFVAKLFLCVGLLFNLFSFASDWQLIGPEGGNVRSLAYDPGDPNRILLGTSSGQLFISQDGGNSWAIFAHLGPGDDYVFDHIVFDPTNPAILYAAAWGLFNDNDGGVFRSDDGGRTWRELMGAHGKSIRALAIAPSDHKAIQTFQLWVQSYPRDYTPYSNLGATYPSIGQYEKSVEVLRERLRINPDSSTAYANLAGSYLALNRFPEARDITNQGLARRPDYGNLHEVLYTLAFLQGDSAEMAQQAAWSKGKADAENVILGLESNTEAYFGRLEKARELTRPTIVSAESAQNKEAAAWWSAEAAIREALFGNVAAARERANAALSLAPGSRGAEIEAALAGARDGRRCGARAVAHR